MKTFIFTLSFISILHLSFSQKLNRLNKRGERTGKWIIYANDEKTIKYFEGRFKNGLSVGKNYYYNSAGILDRKEINRFKKMKTICYFQNGNIRQKGNARIEILPDKIHYYFYGKWTIYNDSNKIIKYNYYEKGKLIKTTYLNKNIKTNDSLIEALNSIDKDFTSYNKIYADSIHSNIKNDSRNLLWKNELKYRDSITFSKIAYIFDNYGYPSKEIAGESNSIPFYIISYAPLSIKERYLNTLILAADRDYISWKSLAFFIDKIHIAKNEKQIYGTQGTFDEKHKYTMYPCQDPENLNPRRERVGLEKL